MKGYVDGFREDVKKAKYLYQKTHEVEFSVSDNWVKVGGVVINGINKKMMLKILKEIDGE